MKLRTLLLGAVAGLSLFATGAVAATQVFPFAGIFADAVAAYIMGPNGSAAASATNPVPTQLSFGNAAVTVTNPVAVQSFAPGGETEAVAASDTDEPLGATGAIGDYLEHVVLFVATAATAATTIKDGATTLGTFANSPGGGIGTYVIPIRARAVGAGFSITTGAGVTVLAVGNFT